MTTLRVNVLSNYVGQAYVSTVGLVVLPLYLQYLGAEGFGLVGFYTLVETWMKVLDMGMAPLLSRQMATIGSTDQRRDSTRRVLRSMECIFALLAIGLGVALYSGRAYVAGQWLDVNELDLDTVTQSVTLIGLTVGVRWLFGLYWSALVGLERQFLLNLIHIVFVTLRFPCSLFVLHVFDGSVVKYFEYQFALMVLQMLTMQSLVYRSLPAKAGRVFLFYFQEMRPLFGFALGLAYSAATVIIVSNIDKLVFSNFLSLAEYGYFTLVASVALAVGFVAVPVSQALLPRLTALFVAEKAVEMASLYNHGTRFVAYMVFPVATFLATYPEAVVFAWTGDRDAAAWCAQVLPWYVLASGVSAIAAFPYYLQFARGNVRLHVIYNTMILVIGAPVLIYLARYFGPVAVGVCWLCIWLVSFFVWAPFVHRRLAPGIHSKWLLVNILPPAAICLVVWIVAGDPGAIGLDSRSATAWNVGVRAAGFSLLLLACYLLHLFGERRFARRV